MGNNPIQFILHLNHIYNMEVFIWHQQLHLPPPLKKKQKNPKHTSKNAMFIHYINVLNLYTFTILGHDILNFYLYLHWNWSSQNQQYQVKSFKAFYTV